MMTLLVSFILVNGLLPAVLSRSLQPLDRMAKLQELARELEETDNLNELVRNKRSSGCGSGCVPSCSSGCVPNCWGGDCFEGSSNDQGEEGQEEEEGGVRLRRRKRRKKKSILRGVVKFFRYRKIKPMKLRNENVQGPIRPRIPSTPALNSPPRSRPSEILPHDSPLRTHPGASGSSPIRNTDRRRDDLFRSGFSHRRPGQYDHMDEEPVQYTPGQYEYPRGPNQDPRERLFLSDSPLRSSRLYDRTEGGPVRRPWQYEEPKEHNLDGWESHSFLLRSPSSNTEINTRLEDHERRSTREDEWESHSHLLHSPPTNSQRHVGSPLT